MEGSQCKWSSENDGQLEGHQAPHESRSVGRRNHKNRLNFYRLEATGQLAGRVNFAEWWNGTIDEGLSKTTVRGIIKPTEHGKPRSALKVKESDLICNRKMIWEEDRYKSHCVPSVFSPTGLVERKLVAKELASALDFPSVLVKDASDGEIDKWINAVGPPFKTRIQTVRLIQDFISQDRFEDTSMHGKTECLKPAHEPRMKADDEEHLPDEMDDVDSNDLFIEERAEDRNLKATKADDAAIPYELWNDRILDNFGLTSPTDRARGIHALDWIRHGMLKFWKRRVAKDFWNWWSRSQGSMTDQEKKTTIAAGLCALRHSALASWWDWDEGSSPFFWRMPDPGWMVDMRDGVKPMWIGPPPSYRKSQRPNADPAHLALEKKKIGKVRRRGYIAPTAGIRSLTSFFSVPKGPTDIRMVYDGTKSGPNDSLLAPWFGLATVDSMLRTQSTNSHGRATMILVKCS